MARLSLSLLGPFEVTLDGVPVTAFDSNKVRALLAYLAVEADGPQAWEEALVLYRGPFLEGFSVGDSAAFDDWALRAREQFERQVLGTLGRLAAQCEARGEVGRAAKVYALASRYPWVANSRMWEDVAGKHIAAVAATLPPDAVAAAQERGRVRDLWATVEELLTELGKAAN
jgi:DNA-binding SARP family transcriptional activator